MSIDQLLSDRQRKRAMALILARPLVSQCRLSVAVCPSVALERLAPAQNCPTVLSCVAVLASRAAAAAECIQLLPRMLSNVDGLRRHGRISAAGRYPTLTRRPRQLLITLSAGAGHALFVISPAPSPPPWSSSSLLACRRDDVIQRGSQRPSKLNRKSSDACAVITW